MVNPPGPQSPQTVAELWQRANALCGLTLGQLANHHQLTLPENLKRHKGWIGQLLEHALGADAASAAEPDFTHLGIEMKGLPIGANGEPKESTYVCTVPLEGASAGWERSWIRRKLARVLWVPYEAGSDIPLPYRRIGQPLLWSPSDTEELLLRRDWEELMEIVQQGRINSLSARFGEVLQIRPKAANARVKTRSTAEDGTPLATNPRGFYLRPAFTAAILRRGMSGELAEPT